MDIPISIPHILGGAIESISISNILFGIAVTQFYTYVRNWDRDPKWLRGLATSILLLEVVFTAVSQRAQYFFSVLSIGNPIVLFQDDWSIPTISVLLMLTEIAVRGFYVHRIWIFSKNLPLFVGMSLLLVATSSILLVCITYLLKFEILVAAENPVFKVFMIASWSSIMCTDVFTSLIMVYYLYHQQSQFTRTRGIIGWLILYFVSTGAISIAFSAAGLICFIVDPFDITWAGMIMLYTRALSNSFFGILNARQVLRNQLGQVISLGGISLQEPTVSNSFELHPVRVQVSHDAIIKTDSNPTPSDRGSEVKRMDTFDTCNV